MLTWNEIRTRAAQFADRWQGVTKENAAAQTFWNEFLAVYGVDRRRVAVFEKSDYSYAGNTVYNTFPWPDRAVLKPKQVQAVEQAAQQVLDARAKFPGSTLADLYDPLTMPADLRKAHNALDRAVDALYGLGAGSTEAQRLVLLLTKYQELAPTLESQSKMKSKRQKTRKNENI